MKLLYPLIILFAFSFAETYTIEYEKDKLFGESEIIVLTDATFKRLENDILMFSNSKNFLGDNIIGVHCSSVLKIVDDRTGFEYNKCYDFLKATMNVKTKIKPTKKSNEISSSPKNFPQVLGGLSIAIGSGLLINNLDSEPAGNETAEEFADRFRGSQKVGYTFILIGGLLIGFSE